MQNQFRFLFSHRENLKMRQSLFVSDKKLSKLFCMNTFALSWREIGLVRFSWFTIHSVRHRCQYYVISLHSNVKLISVLWRILKFSFRTKFICFKHFHNFEMQMFNKYGNVKSEKSTNRKEKFPFLITLFNNDLYFICIRFTNHSHHTAFRRFIAV